MSFQAKKDANQVLNDWSSDINALLNLVEKTCHLISKEVSFHQKMALCTRADFVRLRRKWFTASLRLCKFATSYPQLLNISWFDDNIAFLVVLTLGET